MAGGLTAAVKAPLLVALFTLVQTETAPNIAVAVVDSALLTAILALYSARRAAAQAATVVSVG